MLMSWSGQCGNRVSLCQLWLKHLVDNQAQEFKSQVHKNIWIEKFHFRLSKETTMALKKRVLFWVFNYFQVMLGQLWGDDLPSCQKKEHCVEGICLENCFEQETCSKKKGDCTASIENLVQFAKAVFWKFDKNLNFSNHHLWIWETQFFFFSIQYSNRPGLQKKL